MGLDRTIHFPTGQVPSWYTIQSQLARVGEVAPIRMIDGMPAFPDEIPEEGWKELRISSAAGMITIRRRDNSIHCVIWGNAEAGLSLSWMKVTWACAAAGQGQILLPDGPVSPEEFAQSFNLTID